jgi:hypothetical protein
LRLLKLQRLQTKVLLTIDYFPRRTPVRDMHVAFKIPYVYDVITKLCRKEAEVMQNHYTVFSREKPHFFDKSLPSKIGAQLIHVLLTTEPAMPVLFVVKLPVESASV